jgi:SpoVK/Ycf46/Vps4 family AAA+-type ATPase
MNKINNTRTDPVYSLVLKLVEAGMEGNRQRLELLSLNAIRALKDAHPDIADKLGTLLSKYSAGGSALRWQGTEPPPTDTDAGLALLRIQPVEDALEPILDPVVREVVDRFLRERLERERLLREGFAPPRTLLLKGAPGTGKTMLALWLARQLGLRLVVLDLASSISSYLGKTGGNLRRSLDYARAMPCALLLDEFDAIGKRRDDATEVGELKRIVSVLLKELEEWPHHSVLIAATNHPELLDPAIHRRFDVVLEVPLPGAPEREAILTRACGHFSWTLAQGFFSALARSLGGQSGSELETMTHAVVRRHVVGEESLTRCFVEELEKRFPGGLAKKEFRALTKSLQETTDLSVREIAALLGKSPSTVQYHLHKEEQDA